MRKKFAMRWRRDALRRGAVISNKGYVLTKREARESKCRRGFNFDAEYKGHTITCIAEDALDAYRIFVQEMDNWFGDD